VSATAPRPSWPGGEEWLSLLEEVFDPASVERLERIGVAPGWEALDVGAGRGSIARWLARRVGPEGRVVVTDQDTDALESIDEPNVEVLRHDVLRDDLPGDSFDLVHCRSLLSHLSEPRLAIDRMVGCLKPGGILLTEDSWLDVGLLSPDPVVVRGVRQLRLAMHGDLARRMPLILREVGLAGVEAEGRLVFFNGGTSLAGRFRRILEGMCLPLVEAGELEREDVERMGARFRDPEWVDCGWPRIAAWGRKPR
jgi:SAM-dependent methyltransferase